MFKRIILAFALTTLLTTSVFAQKTLYEQNETVIEMLGYINAHDVSARKGPGTNHRIMATLRKRSKVIIMAESGDWLRVRLYNGRVGYVHKNYVLIPIGDIRKKPTKNNLDRKFAVEVNSLINQFNVIIRNSVYAQKLKIVPSVDIIDGRKRRGTLSITLLYSAVDNNGRIIISRKENPMQNVMKKLVEVMFLKMLLYEADEYIIKVNTPEFSKGMSSGRYLQYAQLNLSKDSIDAVNVKKSDGMLWNYIQSDMSHESLFVNYPR